MIEKELDSGLRRNDGEVIMAMHNEQTFEANKEGKFVIEKNWIPAYAGMTVGVGIPACAGMT